MLERDAIAAIVKQYRLNHGAMVKALEAFVKTTLKKQTKKTEQEIALRVCEHRHPAGCGQVVCKACHEAIISSLTGEDRELTDEDLTTAR